MLSSITSSRNLTVSWLSHLTFISDLSWPSLTVELVFPSWVCRSSIGVVQPPASTWHHTRLLPQVQSQPPWCLWLEHVSPTVKHREARLLACTAMLKESGWYLLEDASVTADTSQTSMGQPAWVSSRNFIVSYVFMLLMMLFLLVKNDSLFENNS